MTSAVRSTTHLLPSFTIDRPNRSVTFVLPKLKVSPAGRTTIRLPPGSLWTPSPHWHERHDEIFRVVAGTIRLTVDGTTRLVRPEDGAQLIRKYAVHEFMRADMAPAVEGLEPIAEDDEQREQDVVVEEWTDPVDGLKEVFFRNIFSVIQDSSRIYRWKTDLQIYMISAHCDDFPVFVSAAPIWQPLTHIIFWFAMLIGPWLGLRPWYDEYTPPRLRAIAASAGSSVNNAERKQL